MLPRHVTKAGYTLKDMLQGIGYMTYYQGMLPRHVTRQVTRHVTWRVTRHVTWRVTRHRLHGMLPGYVTKASGYKAGYKARYTVYYMVCYNMISTALTGSLKNEGLGNRSKTPSKIIPN